MSAMKCAICKKDFELHELFCLTSFRGANSNCSEECLLVCKNCLSKLASAYKFVSEEEEG